MNKLPELPDYSRDMEIVQALQRLSAADAGVHTNSDEEETLGGEPDPGVDPS